MRVGIGSCSGRNGDKFERLSIPLCAAGWQPLPSSLPSLPLQLSTHSPDAGIGATSTDSAPPAAIDASIPARILSSVDSESKTLHTNSAPSGDSDECSPSTTAGSLDLAIESSVAHIVAAVTKYEEVRGHFLLTCQIERAFVLKQYWSGKMFAPQPMPDSNVATSPSSPLLPPPFLTFFGSQTFGYVVTEDQVPSAYGMASE